MYIDLDMNVRQYALSNKDIKNHCLVATNHNSYEDLANYTNNPIMTTIVFDIVIKKDLHNSGAIRKKNIKMGYVHNISIGRTPSLLQAIIKVLNKIESIMAEDNYCNYAINKLSCDHMVTLSFIRNCIGQSKRNYKNKSTGKPLKHANHIKDLYENITKHSDSNGIASVGYNVSKFDTFLNNLEKNDEVFSIDDYLVSYSINSAESFNSNLNQNNLHYEINNFGIIDYSSINEYEEIIETQRDKLLKDFMIFKRLVQDLKLKNTSEEHIKQTLDDLTLILLSG